MKSVLLLVLFVGLVSARFHHHFDRRQETTTEETWVPPDLGLDCEEFTPPFAGLSDEAAIEAYCGDDDDCLKRAERCKFRLECKTSYQTCMLFHGDYR